MDRLNIYWFLVNKWAAVSVFDNTERHIFPRVLTQIAKKTIGIFSINIIFIRIFFLHQLFYRFGFTTNSS